MTTKTLLLVVVVVVIADDGLAPYEIELEVDGSTRRLVAERWESPSEASRRFCEENGLSVSVEGLPCASTLTEELILRGARYALPSEPVIRLRETDDLALKARATNTFFKGNDLDMFTQSLIAHVSCSALGPGELQVPLFWNDTVLLVREPRLRVPIRFKDKKIRVLLAWPLPGQSHISYGRSAATFCIVHQCSYKVASKIASELANSEVLTDKSNQKKQRVVLSMSTLPGRIQTLELSALLYEQRQSTDMLYLAVPDKSTRQDTKYEIPFYLIELERFEARFQLIRCHVDWGPATKLIPVLLIETEPSTIIISVDDDLHYPPNFVADLVHGATRRPDAAVGFRGYRLPIAELSDKEEQNYYRHENLIYLDSADSSHDRNVHVLGGLAGIAYRSGFFDYRRLIDYSNWPGGAFFVDDDWISLVLDEAHIPRLVLGSVSASRKLRDDAVLLPHHQVAALNAPGHAFRNMAFQAHLLATARQRNIFVHNSCRFTSSTLIQYPILLSFLDDRVCNSSSQEEKSLVLVIIHDEFAEDWILLLDRFLAYHEHGTLYILCQNQSQASKIRDNTSSYTLAIDCDNALTNFLWHLGGSGLTADLIGIGSQDITIVAAALGSGLFHKQHTYIISSTPFFTDVGCTQITQSYTAGNISSEEAYNETLISCSDTSAVLNDDSGPLALEEISESSSTDFIMMTRKMPFWMCNSKCTFFKNFYYTHKEDITQNQRTTEQRGKNRLVCQKHRS